MPLLTLVYIICCGQKSPHLGYLLQMASFQSQLTMDRDDPLYHCSYLVHDTSLSLCQYLAGITYEYKGWYTEFDSIFIGFHTLQVCLLFVKLLAH
jgi:hypothetical protein